MVWDVLSAEHRHLTANEVLEAARRADPSLNLSSVYRTLGLLAELGLARESRMSGDGPSRWELIHDDDQIHLVCERCGAIEHHGGPFVEQLRCHLTDHHHFQARTVELTVFGSCARCAARASHGIPDDTDGIPDAADRPTSN